MSKPSRQNSSGAHQNKPMQHYLYADMDFINSFLAQSGKGLHLTSRQTNSNTNGKKEDRSTSSITAQGNALKKGSPTLELGAFGSKLGVGGDEKSDGELTVTIEGLERGEDSLIYTEQAIEVALHDYAIKMFIETVADITKTSNGQSDYFLALDKEWSLLDYSNTLSEKLDAYAELFGTGLIEDADKTLDVINTISPQAKAILKVMNSTFPTPYAIRRKNRHGVLDEKWMRYSMKFLVNDFGMTPKFNVLGIKTTNNKTVVSDEILDNPKKLMSNLSQFLDQSFLTEVTETNSGDYMFRPIVIYRTLN
ncbi:hypothetical protein [Exiguobacterium sp. s138]|uniref:hypothetical protein n=1 Tax=Exiguobacterium sp. s138 TaxID=2751202 RepID=UPI001BE6E3FF|nr:hypothetical protein [Exiguobacterium sp. s138]